MHADAGAIEGLHAQCLGMPQDRGFADSFGHVDVKDTIGIDRDSFAGYGAVGEHLGVLVGAVHSSPLLGVGEFHDQNVLGDRAGPAFFHGGDGRYYLAGVVSC